MPVYDYDTFRDLKVYNVNVRNNKQCFVVFSGTWYPSFNPRTNILCDYLNNHYCNEFDIFVVSSKLDYIRLYYNDAIYDYFEECHNVGYKINCFCFCISTSFISNVIYNFKNQNINIISYESSFDNYKQCCMNPYIGYDINSQYIHDNKKIPFSVDNIINAPSMAEEVMNIAMYRNNITSRELRKLLRINMKSNYTLYCIFSINNLFMDYKDNIHYQMKNDRFRVHNYILHSYSHTGLLNKYRWIFEPTQYKLFFRHLDDIIARLI